MDIQCNIKGDLSVFGNWREDCKTTEDSWKKGCPYLITSKSNRHFAFFPSDMEKFIKNSYHYMRDGDVIRNGRMTEIIRECLNTVPDNSREGLLNNFFELAYFSPNEDYLIYIVTDSCVREEQYFVSPIFKGEEPIKRTHNIPYTFWVFKDNQ